jgi:hypothetical protein
MLKTCRIAGALALGAVTAFVIPAHGSSARFFQAATQTDFLKGELENLSVDSRGQLTLGPRTELVYDASSPVLWTMLPRPDGSLLVGSGNDGKVFRVDNQGRGTTFFDAQELEVHALAAGADGTVFAGSSPDGKIYKIDRAGAATTFFDPEDKYIWALAVDARGNVFAATGEKGIVYRITPDGKGEPFFKTKATHATALTFDSSGRLLIATESPGRVYRVETSGRGFLLLDTPFDEVRGLRFDAKGVLYVVAQTGRDRGSSPSTPDTSDDRSTDKPAGADSGRAPVPTVTTEITSVTLVDSPSSGTGSVSEDSRTAKGAVYRIAADGLWDRLWESRDDAPYDVALDGSGRLVVATGNNGKIFRLEGEPLRPTLVTRAGAQQVTALQVSGSGPLYFTTANPGKVYRLSAEPAERGTYESQVFDAGTVSTWGAVRWHGQPDAGRIEVSTRSGNSSTPDDTWSPWSDRYGDAKGSPISSPNARYLQWRAVFNRGGQNALTSIAAAYLQRNVRPQVRSVTIHPPGIVFQKPYSNAEPDLAGFDNQTTPDRKLSAAAANQSSGSSMGRRGYEKGLQTIGWKADDENGDDLTYDVEYRREGESAWKRLRTAVTESIIVWDTTTVANGTYFIRVVASDAPSNGADGALTGDLDSSAFDVDNSAPSITVRNVRTADNATRVSLEISDDQSVIQRVEWSRDGQEWQAIFPQDGIADSRNERYEIPVTGAIGPRGLIVRATDAMNNVATTEVAAR